MYIYESLCACAVIAAASGALRDACARRSIRPFAIAYAGAVLLLISPFSVMPLAELRCNAAVIFLPIYFLIQKIDAKRNHLCAASTWRTMFLAALLPVVWTLAAALIELCQRDYACVALDGVALRNVQVVFCAVAFCGILVRNIRREAHKPA